MSQIDQRPIEAIHIIHISYHHDTNKANIVAVGTVSLISVLCW